MNPSPADSSLLLPFRTLLQQPPVASFSVFSSAALKNGYDGPVPFPFSSSSAMHAHGRTLDVPPVSVRTVPQHDVCSRICRFRSHPPSSKCPRPAIDLVTWNKMQPLHQAQAKALVDKEIAASLSKDKEYPYSGVMGKMLRRPERDYAFALGVLRLRTELQSDVLQIFQLLLEKNFIMEETLMHPINLNTTDSNVGRVLCTLRCFEEWRIEQFNNLGPDFIFDAPLKWLAIIIVRSNSEYQSLFAYLKDAKVLGGFNEHDHQRIRGALGEWTAGNGGKVATECLTDPRPFGFVLPIQGVQEVQNAIQHAASRLLSVTELCRAIGTAALQDRDSREECAF